MKSKSTLRPGGIAILMIIFLFGTITNAKPIDYEDVENLLPTEPQTTNDTLAAIVQDPVVQDAVQSAVGNGSLQGLVVKKKVLIMPATEPTKVVSQREQVLVVPMMHLEDVRKNITETVTAETDVDGLTFTNTQSFTENDENGNTDGADNPFYVSQPVNFYEALTKITTPMRKPTIPIDTTPQEIPYFIPNPSLEMALTGYEPPAISIPIVAFLDPSKISDDKIDVPITAALPIRDDFLKSQLNYLKNGRDDVQREVESYADKTSWNVQPTVNRRLFSAPSEGV
ncbi:uncharacterized protein LOC109860279 isoform X2 [Pseudomyrmex gracilis]|uniref:uncharacterized protein LOC109860279 isoform X2 n=1 Tax=Pseudomyrmex gracilis TaxID=219809 RepID=UPI000995AD06|nr:uncharacterized protein LOC109860279 isoform X2 [Pseudomyrmex gracilis]